MFRADDGELIFTDDLPERLATVETGFSQRMGRALDAYIATAGSTHLSLGFVEIAVFDAWSYPHRVRGVTEQLGRP